VADPLIHGFRATVSASDMVNSLADTLGEIRQQDRLTWADMGVVLGKSEDQAAKYADGSAVMDITTFWRARRCWGSRFTGYFDRLCAGTDQTNDRLGQTEVLSAALALLQALLSDNTITPSEVKAIRRELELARDAIEAQLKKL
jgi:cyanate lyase